MNIALLGGDERQGRLGKLLAKDGHEVSTFGMERLHLINIVKKSASLEAAVEKADAVVLPLPVSRDGVLVNAPFSEKEIRLEDVLNAGRAGQLLLAAKAGDAFCAAAEGKGMRTADYSLREEFAILNANATAEAALEIVMRERDSAVLGSSVLITGFGRIGKILALRMKNLGANVTVSARKKSDLAWMKVLGIAAANTERLENISQYNIIINTIPHEIFTDKLLNEVDERCFCLDLASAPGGFDMEAAEKRNIKIRWALALPGKAVPESAAEIIRDTVYNIMEELECSH